MNLSSLGTYVLKLPYDKLDLKFEKGQVLFIRAQGLVTIIMALYMCGRHYTLMYTSNSDPI